MRHRMIALAVLAPLALGGCVTNAAGNPPTEPQRRMAQGSCDAAPAQSHLGHKASGEAGSKLLEITGARTLRWVPPRTAVTMDYRPDRLTVSYDDNYTITRISCG